MASVTRKREIEDARPVQPGPDGDGFHEWLQYELRARRMSQRQLAQRSGVDHSSISRLLRGERVPSLRTAMRIAHSVDLSMPSDGFPPEAAPNGRATARVEYALRADDQLGEADIRRVMLYYLDVRRGGPARTRSPEIEAGRVMPGFVVARTAGSAGLWGSLDRRRSSRSRPRRT